MVKIRIRIAIEEWRIVSPFNTISHLTFGQIGMPTLLFSAYNINNGTFGLGSRKQRNRVFAKRINLNADSCWYLNCDWVIKCGSQNFVLVWLINSMIFSLYIIFEKMLSHMQIGLITSMPCLCFGLRWLLFSQRLMGVFLVLIFLICMGEVQFVGKKRGGQNTRFL